MSLDQFFSIVVPVVVFLVFLAAVFTIRYEVTEREIRIRILGFTVRRISLYDIEEIKKGKALVAENWSVNLFGREDVSIRKKRGLLKNVNLAPPHADQFIAEVRDRIASLPPEPIRPGWKPG